jgi:hypothetical protein
MTKTTITDVRSRYGAPHGRVSRGEFAEGMRLYVRRVPLRRGGYDAGGAYWGLGLPLWECFDSSGTFACYLRCVDRASAKAELLAAYPGAKFGK